MLSYSLKQPPAPPSSDKRWKIVAATMRRHGHSSDALIETLHTVQEAFGYIDDDAMRFVAVALRVPLSRVYGVVTFYQFFTYFAAKSAGRHACVVCTGTACHIKGSPHILAAIESQYGLRPGETSAGGECSLLTARCLGSCGLAPAAVFDGEIAGKQSPAAVAARLAQWMPHDAG